MRMARLLLHRGFLSHARVVILEQLEQLTLFWKTPRSISRPCLARDHLKPQRSSRIRDKPLQTLSDSASIAPKVQRSAQPPTMGKPTCSQMSQVVTLVSTVSSAQSMSIQSLNQADR